MTDPLALETYDYELPEELIAQYPLEIRDSSRLMRVSRAKNEIEHLSFDRIVDFLNPDEVLVINDSKVIPARLYGQKDNGTRVEILLLNELEPLTWKCMVHPGKRLKQAQWLSFSDRLKGFVSIADKDGLRQISFEVAGSFQHAFPSPAEGSHSAAVSSFWHELEAVGHVPLPPYIKRPDELPDRQTYQTVYARERGSVAAPTAGLHFTPGVLAALQDKGVQIARLTLHVGMGTFLPVKSDRIDEHKMHSEFCTVSPEAANAVNLARTNGKRIIAVGSTSARTLESFFDGDQLLCGSRWTDIFIYPGRKMRVVDAMLTNFHLPKSSLLMMISAFAGIELIKTAYREAVARRYRFFSYGDAMLIE